MLPKEFGGGTYAHVAAGDGPIEIDRRVSRRGRLFRFPELDQIGGKIGRAGSLELAAHQAVLLAVARGEAQAGDRPRRAQVEPDPVAIGIRAVQKRQPVAVEHLVAIIALKRFRARRADHRAGPADRFGRGAGGRKLAALGQVQQLVVGHAEPEEIRQPHCQLEVAHRVSLARGAVGPIGFDAIEKLRRNQHALERQPHRIDVAEPGCGRPIEQHQQPLDVGRGALAAIRAAGDAVDDRARGLARRGACGRLDHQVRLAPLAVLEAEQLLAVHSGVFLNPAVDERAQLGAQQPVERQIGRGEILLQQRRRNIERDGQIGKAGRVAGLVGHAHLGGRVEFETQQVVDRAIVFLQAQARIGAGPGSRLAGSSGSTASIDCFSHPSKRRALGGRELRLVGRRHGAGFDLGHRPAPQAACRAAARSSVSVVKSTRAAGSAPP